MIVAAGELDASLWRHELEHVSQYERMGFAFLPVYVWLLWRHGYANHPLEREAVVAAARESPRAV